MGYACSWRGPWARCEDSMNCPPNHHHQAVWVKNRSTYINTGQEMPLSGPRLLGENNDRCSKRLGWEIAGFCKTVEINLGISPLPIAYQPSSGPANRSQHRWTRNLRFKHEHKDATSSWNISGDHYTQVWTNLLATPIQSSFPGSPHLLPEALHTTTRLQLSNSPPLEKSKNFTEALETYFWAPWSLSTTTVHNMTASIVFLPR